MTDPAGHTRRLTYPAYNTMTATTTFEEKDGGIWTSTYNTVDNLLKEEIDPNGKAVSYTYYPDGTLKSRTEPYDSAIRYTTFYTYDQYGNLLTITEPADLSIYSPPIDPETVDVSTLGTLNPPIKTALRYTYDNNTYDRILSISDERGANPVATAFQYSTEGSFEVITITDPDSHATKYRFNPDHTIKDITDANNKTISFEYYPATPENIANGIAGLLLSIKDLSGVTTAITVYDRNDNPREIKVSDKTGKTVITTSLTHDNLNRIREIIHLTASLPANITKYNYDLMANLTSHIDPENKETKYEYRFDQQIKKITDALLHETNLTYSGAGCASCSSGADKLIEIKDANQHPTSFAYDKLGRLETEIDPLNNTIKYIYYDNGLIKQKIDATTAPEKILITYSYNNYGQLVRKQYPDATEETFTYYPDGRRKTASNQHITYTLSYYNNGWLKSIEDNSGRKITYDTYDGIGNKKQATVSAGALQQTMSYDYDTANRPWHIYFSANTFTFDYDDMGRRKTLAYPNQTIATYGYDDLDRLTSLTHKTSSNTTIDSFSYTYYDAGNRKTINKNGKLSTYTYDNVERLTNVAGNETEAFTYDPVGNRLTDSQGRIYTPNEANQLITQNTTTFTYDALGNMASKTDACGLTTYQYDYENRLIAINGFKPDCSTLTASFKYDPFGRRIEKNINGVITKYFYDREDILYEYNQTGKIQKFYIHGPGIDEPLSVIYNNTFYYYHTDGLGSVTAVTDATGKPVQRYQYDSFGNITAPRIDQPYTYTGREYDKETGLYYYRNRYYDPKIGRFITRDPIGFAGGINFYSYVNNRPTRFVDPWGLLECQIGPNIPKNPFVPQDINKFDIFPKIPGKLKLEPDIDPPQIDYKNLLQNPQQEIDKLTKPKNWNWEIFLRYEYKF